MQIRDNANGGEGAANGAAGDLAGFVRDEIRPPVAALREAVAALVLAVRARRPDAAYARDLARVEAATGSLDAVSARPPLEEPAPGGVAGPVRAFRHDLRTPITAILGYCELVAEEAEEASDDWLLPDLDGILAKAAELLGTIDRLSAFAAASPAPASRPASAVATPASLAAAAERNAAQRAPGGGRVLVVDDNPSMRDLISRRIRRQGHEVVAAPSGEAALELTADGGFDLLMLDLLMPGLSGLDVLHRLKQRPASVGIPVIVMSALDDLDAAVRCIEAGADDYLSKPIDETLLRARIGSSLERKFLRDRERETLQRLQAEQQRSDALLHNILPGSVVKRLRAGETVIADQFERVTVLFCDLVGFTALASRLEPARTLRLLGDIFARFDALAEKNGLEKIKTIGDAYMVVGGMGGLDGDGAAGVAAMAREMPAAARGGTDGGGLSLRIGIDTGPAAGGIIGTKKFFYDVWGDTVNTASRLEHSCEPGRIHVSAATREALGGGYPFEQRAPIDLAGKGRMQTYYLCS